MPLSVWVLSSDHLRDVEDYNARLTLEDRRDTGKNFQVIANSPLPPLAPLYRGVAPESANSVTLRFYMGWNTPLAVNTQAVTNDIFPTVDLTFIIGVVISALALMLTFDAVSGEKAEATLRLIMSNPVSRWKIIFGKWIGYFLALIIPFLLGLIISMLIFISVTGLNLTGNEWAAFSLTVLAALVYLSLFVLIGILISALTKNPSVSIFICLAVWGLFIVIIPQLANLISDYASPIPAPQIVEKDIRVKYNEFANTVRENNLEIVRKARQEGLTYRQANRQRNQQEFTNAIKNRSDANQLEREFWNQIESQERIGRLLSLFSPYGCFSQAVIALANTGPEGQRTFLRQAYSYGEKYFSYVWTEAIKPETTWEGIYDSAPEFTYSDVTFAERLNTMMLPFTTLVILNVLVLFAGIIAFNRYDVR
jgi:ABC-type transport system involved in multi-copper enzyme maturation permease subunit